MQLKEVTTATVRAFVRPQGAAAQDVAPPLVMRCGAFGDIVLLTVLLRQLYLRFGQLVDVISSGPWTQSLLKGQPVRNLILLRSRRTPYWLSADQKSLVQWMRERGPGPAWFCDRDVGRDLLTRGGLSDDFICDVRDVCPLPQESFADLYIRMANTSPAALAGRLPPPVPGMSRAAHLEVDAADYHALRRWQARHGLLGCPCVLVHPGNRRTTRGYFRRRRRNTKYWPEIRWARVLRAIRDVLPTHAIILSGVAAEFQLNAQIRDLAQVPNVHNAAGDLPIQILLPLLTFADSMIATDTGPAHASAALGCPTVALFGTADPYLYRPGGATTAAVPLTGAVDGCSSMLGISDTAVVDAWLRVRSNSVFRGRNPSAPNPQNPAWPPFRSAS